jgi:hypothetical protein
MSDTPPIGFPEAARRLGVSLRVLRRAIRAGRLPAPPQLGATAALPPEWLASAMDAAEASPNALSRATAQKVPPFARYKGTSAWRKYSRRVREHARFQAAAAEA